MTTKIKPARGSVKHYEEKNLFGLTKLTLRLVEQGFNAEFARECSSNILAWQESNQSRINDYLIDKDRALNKATSNDIDPPHDFFSFSEDFCNAMVEE